MSKLDYVAKALTGTAKVFGELWKVAKLLVYLGIACAVAYVVYVGKEGIQWLTNPFSSFSKREPIPVNLPEIVSEEALKCRAYTLVVNFEGSSRRLDIDKVRILKTVAAYKRTQGVGDCDIFERQMELSVPGAKRRSFFDRRLWYVEREFGQTRLNEALLLAKDLAQKPDLAWEPIVLIRPPRRNTSGNQTAAEIKAIEDAMEEVNVGESDFRFFKPKHK